MEKEKEALKSYRDLLAKVDGKFSQIFERNPQQFQCGKGCHSCCVAGITVSPIERENIGHYLRSHSIAEIELTREPEKFCSFLTAIGTCSIYEARPVVCRTQGAPLELLKEDGDMLRDVCPLNFTSSDLSRLPNSDVLATETIQTILAALNLMAFGKENSQNRVLLSPDLVQLRESGR